MTPILHSAKKVAVARLSEDFMPTEPTFQMMHIAGIAYACLLAGEIIVPDWDMLHVRWLLLVKLKFSPAF